MKAYLVIGAIAYANDFFSDNTDDDVYLEYQDLENRVYSLFIKAEQGF